MRALRIRKPLANRQLAGDDQAHRSRMVPGPGGLEQIDKNQNPHRARQIPASRDMAQDMLILSRLFLSGMTTHKCMGGLVSPRGACDIRTISPAGDWWWAGIPCWRSGLLPLHCRSDRGQDSLCSQLCHAVTPELSSTG